MRLKTESLKPDKKWNIVTFQQFSCLLPFITSYNRRFFFSFLVLSSIKIEFWRVNENNADAICVHLLSIVSWEVVATVWKPQLLNHNLLAIFIISYHSSSETIKELPCGITMGGRGWRSWQRGIQKKNAFHPLEVLCAFFFW